MRAHRRQNGGYGAEMRAEDDALVIYCRLEDCDWSAQEAPIERDTEIGLYLEWRSHRQVHAHSGVTA